MDISEQNTALFASFDALNNPVPFIGSYSLTTETSFYSIQYHLKNLVIRLPIRK